MPKALEQTNLPIIRVGIIGTGYIADFHAHAIQELKGVELAAVCDVNLRSAELFGKKWGIPTAFGSLEALLRGERVDVVHLLVPPDAHFPLAKLALGSKIHVLVEKPMCVSTEEADELLALAQVNGVRLGVGHNMLYATAYQRLREIVRRGILGPLDHVIFNHFVELGQIRSGPFDSWMLRAPGNLVFEIGPHLFSALLDLLGKPDDVKVSADRDVELPGGARVFRRWRVNANVGRTAVDVHMNFSPGFPQRTIYVRGLFGSALLDFDANICTVDRRTVWSLDWDRYKRSTSLAHQIRIQARQTLADYALSKLKLRRRGGPYPITFLDSIAGFYSSIRAGTTLDPRIDGQSGRDVVELCSTVIKTAGINSSSAEIARRRNAPVVPPSVLVIGGAGFIGYELISQLLAAGYSVRAMTRSSRVSLETFDSDHLELVRGDMRNESDLNAAMQGVDFVYNLATAQATSWTDRVKNEVEPARLLGESCIAAGIKRLIYTGTIDSYYAGSRAGTITEATPLDPNIRRRNYYARAKAAAEGILMDLHRTKKLPVVIFRPGIVIGRGGNPFHFGVGMWTSDCVCEVWGKGDHPLPFVLVSDVAAALVRGIQVDGIEGRSYNLVDIPLLTAGDYLDEIRQITGMPFTVYYRSIWRFYLADFAKWIVKLAVRHPELDTYPELSRLGISYPESFFRLHPSAHRFELVARVKCAANED